MFDLMTDVWTQTPCGREPMGLLVWIPPREDARPPDGWRGVLLRRRVCWCGLHHCGNEVEATVRVRRAIDVGRAFRRELPIDHRRCFVGGFSGGARAATAAAMNGAGIFTGGALLCGGVGYHRDVPVQDDGRTLPAVFTISPLWSLLEPRRQQRYSIVVGEQDEWLNPARAVYSEMSRDGFAGVSFFQVPRLGHEPPPAEVFERALEAAEGRVTAEAAR
jgi:predicted esterase